MLHKSDFRLASDYHGFAISSLSFLQRLVMRHGILGLALALMSVLPAPASVYVSGRVFNYKTYHPIPGAVVFLDQLDGDLPARTISQAPCLNNGSFIVRAPAAGHYRLKVVRSETVLFQELITVPKVASFAVDLAVGSGPQAVPTFQAPTPGAPPSPILLDLTTGLGSSLSPGPVDAWVELLWPAQANPCGTGGILTVRQDGSLLLPLPIIPPGLDTHSALVEVTLRRPSKAAGGGRMEGWPAIPISLFLPPPLALRGVIHDRADAPVPNATVLATRMVRVGCILRRADHFIPAIVTADAAGRFSIPNLCAGTYDVRALVPAGVACRKLFVLSPARPDCILNAREDPAWAPLAPADRVQD